MLDEIHERAARENPIVEVLATVRHELNSPLAVIQGYAVTLIAHAEQISQEEQREFLLAIHDASKHLESLIARILELSRLETGTIELEYATINVVSLLQECLAMHTARPSSHPLVLSTETEQTQQDALLVRADHRRLREVVDLLLENAQAYSPAGAIIELGAHRLTLDGQGQRMIELWVHDTGTGIPVWQHEAIFHRFHRLDTDLTREINGLGLGLTICKHLVELQSGTIRVESKLGEGSTFYVRLPECDIQ